MGERLSPPRVPVEFDPVALGHERVQLTGLAVDGHAAGLDQLVCLPPRSDPGPGEVGVQAHERILACVTGAFPMGATFLTTLASGRRLGRLGSRVNRTNTPPRSQSSSPRCPTT